MTEISDDFDTIDLAVWTIQVVGGGTIAAANGLAGSTGANNYLYKTAAVTGVNQKLEAIVSSTAEGPTQNVLLWARLIQAVAPTLDAGYAVMLNYGASGVRTLSLLKVDTTTHIAHVLISRTVTLSSVAATDLNVNQHLRLVVFDDRDVGTGVPERSGVVVRGYLNELDDGNPTLEFRDLGVTATGSGLPVHRAAGTWAITFGAAVTIQVDAFYGTDQYEVPDQGAYGADHSTRLELRTRVQRELSVGGVTNYNQTLLDDCIRHAIWKTMTLLGDRNYFANKLVQMTLDVDTSTKRITLPHDVGRVQAIWDATAQFPIDFVLVGHLPDGRAQIYCDGMMTSRDCIVSYVPRWTNFQTDGDYSPLPKECDPVVVDYAVLRMAQLEGLEKLSTMMEAMAGQDMELLLIAMAQTHRQKKQVMQVVRRPRPLGRYGALDRSGLFQIGY